MGICGEHTVGPGVWPGGGWHYYFQLVLGTNESHSEGASGPRVFCTFQPHPLRPNIHPVNLHVPSTNVGAPQLKMTLPCFLGIPTQ